MPAFAQPAEILSLRLEAKIPLGDVAGRIDHMAIDLARQRLFIAKLGNDSVSIVDLKERKVLRRISGLNEPQGVGYVQSTDTFYVANGRDGTVRLFRGENYTDAERIKLRSDADNIRVDTVVDHVIVGYGSGALNGMLGANTGTFTFPTFTALTPGHARFDTSDALNGWLTRVWYMPTRQPDYSLPDYTR